MKQFKNIIIIFLSLLLIFCICWIGYQDIPARSKELRALHQENERLQEQYNNMSFASSALKLQYNDTRLQLVDSKLEIIRLQAHEKAYEDMVSILEYSLTYINYLQIRLEDMHQDYGYPEFIVRSVMNDLIVNGIEE